MFSPLCSDGMSVASLLQRQKERIVTVDRPDYQRITVRRKHLWDDSLLKSGINFHKHIRVTFVGEPAVNAGGPLRYSSTL